MKQTERQTIYLKKSYIQFKKQENNFTIGTKFDKYGNKVSMFERVKEVDDKKFTKEKNILFTIEPTSSLPSGNVEYSDEINNQLMIEADVTKKKSIRKLKDDSVFILNQVEGCVY